jgi:hypothetical protein
LELRLERPEFCRRGLRHDAPHRPAPDPSAQADITFSEPRIHSPRPGARGNGTSETSRDTRIQSAQIAPRALLARHPRAA